MATWLMSAFANGSPGQSMHPQMAPWRIRAFANSFLGGFNAFAYGGPTVLTPLLCPAPPRPALSLGRAKNRGRIGTSARDKWVRGVVEHGAGGGGRCTIPSQESGCSHSSGYPACATAVDSASAAACALRFTSPWCFLPDCRLAAAGSVGQPVLRCGRGVTAWVASERLGVIGRHGALQKQARRAGAAYAPELGLTMPTDRGDWHEAGRGVRIGSRRPSAGDGARALATGYCRNPMPASRRRNPMPASRRRNSLPQSAAAIRAVDRCAVRIDISLRTRPGPGVALVLLSGDRGAPMSPAR